MAQAHQSSEWSMSDLERALTNLKNNKSRDSEGLINEIFKMETIATDLKKSLLLMFNKLRAIKMIPEFINFAKYHNSA